jgi:hypothetical protein
MKEPANAFYYDYSLPVPCPSDFGCFRSVITNKISFSGSFMHIKIFFQCKNFLSMETSAGKRKHAHKKIITEFEPLYMPMMSPIDKM